MAIIFHCEHCGKKIESPDSAGGKRGKCPACHNKLYVPGLASDEELKLAPIDTDNDAKQKELMAETYKLTQEILLERDVPEGPAGAAASAPEISDKELTKNIITYLRQMADGKLDEAQRTADSIAPYGPQAVKILDRIALSEMPEPELADIPQQVLSGLIRNLRTRIS
jgi:DNA-directed RNA polymerase subunit RPC12/RpoP